MASTSLGFEGRLEGASNFLLWKVRVTLLLEVEEIVVLGYRKGCDYSFDGSIGFGSSHEERSENQVDDYGCCKGLFDPSNIREDDK